MEIAFKSKKLEKRLTVPSELQRFYGTFAKAITLRINEFRSTGSLGTIKNRHHAHKLRAELDGCISVNITANYRMLFKPNNDPLLLKADGGIDLDQVTKILIINIIDYH
jgi:plasmid maintenance system killer protein